MDRKNPASKVCIDPNLSMHGAVTPPPYYVCNECYREIPKKYQTYCHNIVQPVEDVSLYCENRVSFDAKACCFNLSLIVNQFKSCKSTDKMVFSVCYSSSCILNNQNKPISLCKECHSIKHNKLNQRGEHIYQTYIKSIWECDNKTTSYLCSAITRFLVLNMNY